MIMCIQKLVSISLIVLKILKATEGRNSVANLRKMTICYSNVALVNDIIFTKG